MKTLVNIFFAILIVASIAGCSNSSSNSGKSKKTGTVVFFHNIKDAPELQLNAIGAKDRNGYGTVSFEKFGNGVALKPRKWYLEVVDEQGTADTIDDEVILSDVDFSIKSKDYQIIAFTGVYNTDSPEQADLRMHVLTLAEDIETKDDNEKLIQYINVSHLHKDLGLLNIYLVDEEHSTDNLSLLTPDGTIAFGESTSAIRLQRAANKKAYYYLRIAAAEAPDIEIFNSGERELMDYEKQTILVSPNLSNVGSSSAVAFYYGSGFTKKWYDKDDNIGALRVFNGLKDSLDLDAIADSIVNDSYDRNLANGIGFGQASSFITNMVAEIDTYTVKATNGSIPVSTQIPVDVGSAEYWTVVFYGRTNDAAGIPVKEARNSTGSQASVTFTNAAYFADENKIKPFNVHIKKSNDDLNTFSVNISALDPGSYANILKAKGSYQIYVTTIDNKNIIDSMSIDLKAYTDYHFVIVEDANNFSGYKIIKL